MHGHDKRSEGKWSPRKQEDEDPEDKLNIDKYKGYHLIFSFN